MENKLKLARERINQIDSEMAKLFVERLKASELVAEYKKEHGLEILDPIREAEVIRENSELIENEEYKEYYLDFLKNTISLSRRYQSKLLKEMTVAYTTEQSAYPITVGHGLIGKANEYFNLDRKVFVVTDDGVPEEYSAAIVKLSKSATLYTVRAGEGSKSLSTLESLLTAMANAELGRSDCVVAVGGGVVGDLAGFAASVYMRGVDFYNIPTTLLSQVDSSIGGKTAVNLGGIKNVVGSFKQPKAVLVDTDVLSTLTERHFNNGLAEVIKMAATSDASLFEALEKMSKQDIHANIEKIIVGALLIKKDVVEKDERESGLRRVLNFGHTLGHGIESSEDLGGLYHGECVALGMLPLVSDEVRERLIALLKKVDLPTEYHGDISAALRFVAHDKKSSGGTLAIIICEKTGSFKIQPMSIDAFKEKALSYFNC